MHFFYRTSHSAHLKITKMKQSAAPSFVSSLAINLHVYVNGLSFRQSRGIVTNGKHLPADHMVDLRQHFGEGVLHVDGLQGGGLHEESLILASKGLCLLYRHSPYVTQVSLVAHEHDDDVWVRVASQFLQPPGCVLEGDTATQVVDDEGSDRSSIVCACDCSVSV